MLGVGLIAAMLPDLDVVAFRFGIPYGDAFGHRGASHALFTAALVGLAVAASRRFGVPAVQAGLFVFVATASHGLLDCLTNGGHGVALFWPLADERSFAPFRPIEVSPIGLRRFLTERGAAVLASEAMWVWMPAAAVALALRFGMRRRAAA